MSTSKVAIVTGSTDGIGKGIAEYFALRGVKVIVNGRHDHKVANVVEKIQAQGGTAHGIVAGVDTMEGAKTLVEQSIQRYGTVDYLINNAGVNRPLYVHEIEEEDLDIVINTNLKGTFYCSKFVFPVLRHKGGCIVNISSVQGKVTKSRRSAYAASKSGIDGLTRSLALEWAPYKIRVNAVAPGLIWTPPMERMINRGDFGGTKEDIEKTIPLGRFGMPEDVAEVAYFLCSQASYMTGQVVYVDGGRSSMSIN